MSGAHHVENIVVSPASTSNISEETGIFVCKTSHCNEPQQTGELVAHQHYNLILIPSLLSPSRTIQQHKGKAFSCSASAFAH